MNAIIAAMQGLVVPVLRNVETMNYADIEIGIRDLGTKVRPRPQFLRLLETEHLA